MANVGHDDSPGNSDLSSGDDEREQADEKDDGDCDEESEESSSDSDERENPSSPSLRDISASIDIGTLQCAEKIRHPVLHRAQAERSILALVVDDDYLMGGLEGGDIIIWCLETFQSVFQVHAHAESVLSLYLSEDKQLLFSSGSDSVVNVWSTHDLSRLFSIHSHHDIGDVFCVAFSTRLNTLFSGSQNQSLQWIDLGAKTLTPHSATFPAHRKHRFFDSLGPGGKVTPLPGAASIALASGGQLVTVKRNHYRAYAHSSYVYCMLIAGMLDHEDAGREVLVTGAGDGTIKVWSTDALDSAGLTLVRKFNNSSACVFTLAYDGTFLYAGLASGRLHVYNLESEQLVQRINLGPADVTAVQVLDGVAFCGTSQGVLKHFNLQFSEVRSWTGSQGKILASTRACLHGRDVLVTGGNDCMATLWDVSRSIPFPQRRQLPYGNDELLSSLSKFVAFRTVSGNAKFAGQCNEAVAFLRKLFDLFKARTALLSCEEGINPILYAKFEASDATRARKTVLFYGHYDVVDAEDDADVGQDERGHAFELQSLNGYLYGRGVTDNKGPVLAALYAVADLVENKALNCDVIFLVEGEEEAGSRGFAKVVREKRHLIGKVDWILLSNSYWLDDCIPCLTYGMRGVIHASLTVSSSLPDRHSGMDGKSTMHEPLKDLTVLLGSLLDGNGTDVRIPDFYKQVAPLDESERERYSAIASALLAGHPEVTDHKAFTDSLIQRWREPNLTIHRIEVPESRAAVAISRLARADLSLRIVPNQKAEAIAATLTKFSQDVFARLDSSNTLQVEISSKADPWLGDPRNRIFQVLDEAITAVWNPTRWANVSPSRAPSQPRTFRHPPATSSDRPGATTTTGTTPLPTPLPTSRREAQRRPPNRRASTLACDGSAFTAENMPAGPLYIREGGSIPVIRFLEKELQAPAAMFPCGQASDNAHLPNERIRIQNLYNGREVFRRVFEALPREASAPHLAAATFSLPAAAAAAAETVDGQPFHSTSHHTTE